MARYRKIDIRIWGDAKFRLLSAPQPCGQSLWFYLLTNSDTNIIPGVFRSGEAAMAEALEWSLEGFRKAFQEVLSKGMVKASFKDRLVWVPKAINYNQPESPNVIRGWADYWDELPECELKLAIYHSFKGFAEGLGEGFAKAFNEKIAKPFGKALLNQEQEQEQNNNTSLREVVDSKAADQSGKVAHLNKNTLAIKTVPHCPHIEIIAAYHEILPMCPRVRDWHKTRKQLLKSRWCENAERQTVTWWQQLFAYVNESDFLTGKTLGSNGKPPFVADLEWLLKPLNFAKVIEGKYHRQSEKPINYALSGDLSRANIPIVTPSVLTAPSAILGAL